MKPFLKKLGSYGLTLMLGLGWTWLPLLEQKEWISNEQRIFLTIFISVIFGLYQAWLIFSPRVVDMNVINKRKQAVEHILSRFIDEYRKVLGTISPATKVPDIRVNIMLLTKKPWWMFSRPYLKIYYYAGGLYTDKERELKWYKTQGTCGWAWARKDIRCYDSVSNGHQFISKNLTKEQKDAVGHLKSVSSFPIWSSNGQVIGVLNLDSEENLSLTHFTTQAVAYHAQQCVNCLQDSGAIDFIDGVKE